MEFTAAQIAAMLGGKVTGNGDVKVNTVAKIQEGHNGSISFLANPKYEPFIYTTGSSVVIVNNSFVPRQEIKATTIAVNDAYAAFTALLEEYQKLMNFGKTGVEQPSFIADSAHIGNGHYRGAFSYIGSNAKLGSNVKIYPHAYIGDNVTLGDNVIIYAGVKVYADAKIGSNVTIHAGAVIGSDGFGFAPLADGTYKNIPQLGNVVIEDNVDIGANTVIDRATMGSTVIGQGVKLDNLIQIAHNVVIKKNTVIAAQAGIAGSTTIGENCIIAGQAGIIGHLNLANKTTVSAQSGVSKNTLVEGIALQGSPASEIREYWKGMAYARKIPDMLKRLEKLEKEQGQQAAPRH